MTDSKALHPFRNWLTALLGINFQVSSGSWRGIQLNYWVSKSFSKLFSKSYLAWCNSIELLKLILKILLRWILLKGHVPTSITALVGNLFQKDFEKDFQNVNRIAKVKNLFLKRDFKKIFKIIFNNSIEFPPCAASGLPNGGWGNVVDAMQCHGIVTLSTVD